MTATTRTPIEVDTELAGLDGSLAKLSSRIDSITDLLHHLVGDKRDRRGLWGMSNTSVRHQARTIVDKRYDGHHQIGQYLADITEVIAEISKLNAAVDALDAVYTAAGGWSRFFLAKSHDGHVHSSKHCSTCTREGKATEFGWLPELSGKTEAEAVAEFGEKMCTVCFPSAPADPNFHKPGRRDQAIIDAKAAEKVAKDAEREAKGITNPDGTELVLNGDGLTERPKTLIAAQRLLSQRLGDVSWYRAVGTNGTGHHMEPGWLADAEILIAAIAAKTGRAPEDVRAEYQAKAAKKTARDLKD